MAGGPLARPVQPNPPGGFPADRAPVLMAFAGPARQNRLSVFFRPILAVPQLIVLSVIGIAAEIVLVIGWFGALFMGRLPRFAADFLPGYLRWSTRVSAYLALLTGEYPPFTFDDADYPIRLAVLPGTLNRLAVLFRFVLVIPAAIAGFVAAVGLYTIGLLVTWVIVLIAGIMPVPLYRAIAAVVRYQARINGYLLLLTSEYPWGLFGDRSAAVASAATEPGYGQAPGYAPRPEAGYGPRPEPGYGAPPAPSYGFPPEPGYGAPPEAGYGAPPEPGYSPPEPGYGAPPEPGYAPPPEPGYGAPPAPSYGFPPEPGYGPPPEPGYGPPAGPGYGAPAAGHGALAPGYGAPPPPRQNWWWLALTRGEAQIVGLFVAAGAVVWVLYVVLLAAVVFSSGGIGQRVTAISASTVAYAQLSDAVKRFEETSASCKSSSQALTCVTDADRQVAQSFGTFGRAIHDISMPSQQSAGAASRLALVAGQAQQIFQRLAASTSVGQYQQTVQNSNIEQVLHQLDDDYQALGTALGQ